MSDLSGSDRRKLEKLLGMGGGYVLNFSDRTFGEFFDEYRVEIDAAHEARPRPTACVRIGSWTQTMWSAASSGA